MLGGVVLQALAFAVGVDEGGDAGLEGFHFGGYACGDEPGTTLLLHDEGAEVFIVEGGDLVCAVMLFCGQQPEDYGFAL